MRILFTFILAVALTGSAAGQRLVVDRPDHVLLTTLECASPGAQVWALSTNGQAMLLGPTPYTAVVEFRWGSGWMLKKWEKLSVQTLGDLCSASYLPTTMQWTVTLDCEVRAPGHRPARVREVLASFTRPRELDWDFIAGIPERSALNIKLDPLPGGAGRLAGARAPATVMLAADQHGRAGNFGIVLLEANVDDAEVTVDGAPAGRTPVRLVLREGKHDLTLQKPGYRVRQMQIIVKPDSEERMKLGLAPAP